MATRSLQSILESEFLKFCETPTDAQVQCVAKCLKIDEDFGVPAQWGDDPQGWLRKQLPKGDWYVDLSEEEMEAWDAGISELMHRGEFELKSHGFHCAVGDMFIEIAAQAYQLREKDAVVRRFWPYRYHGNYFPELEPVERRYFPCHALLTNQQVGALLDEFSDYDSLLDTMAQDSPEFVNRWQDAIADDLKEALPALQEIHQQKRMWYSIFDF